MLYTVEFVLSIFGMLSCHHKMLVLIMIKEICVRVETVGMLRAGSVDT